MPASSAILDRATYYVSRFWVTEQSLLGVEYFEEHQRVCSYTVVLRKDEKL